VREPLSIASEFSRGIGGPWVQNCSAQPDEAMTGAWGVKRLE
jgi:hypothetical protein